MSRARTISRISFFISLAFSTLASDAPEPVAPGQADAGGNHRRQERYTHSDPELRARFLVGRKFPRQVVIGWAHEVSEIVHSEDRIARPWRIQEISKWPLHHQHDRQKRRTRDCSLGKLAAGRK